MQPFTKTFKAGASVFHEKDHSRELYIIQEGSILIYRKIGNRELILARLEKGSVFGEMSLIDGKPRSASAKALTESTLILIDADTFHERVRGVPPWFMSIVRTTSEKIRKANQRLQTANADRLEARSIIALAYFFKRFAQPDPDTGRPSLDIASVKRSLVPLLCLTHARLMPILTFLENNGFIEVCHDRLCLKDSLLLDEYAGFLHDLVRKAFDKRPPSFESLEPFCAALADKTVAHPADMVHLDLSADDYWAVLQTAGLDATWKEVTQSFKDFGVVTSRKSDDKSAEGNPCRGALYVLDMNAFKRWTGYFRFSALVPDL